MLWPESSNGWWKDLAGLVLRDAMGVDDGRCYRGENNKQRVTTAIYRSMPSSNGYTRQLQE